MSRRERSCCRSYLAFHLKFLNFLQFFVGVSIVVYSAWMLNQWSKHSRLPPAAPPPQNPGPPLLNPVFLASDAADMVGIGDGMGPFDVGVQMVSGSEDTIGFSLRRVPAPWFIYSFMCVGVLLCMVTCIGHIAAETINGCCLCFYTLLIMILIMVEAALVAFLFIDKHWQEDLPYDSTGELDKLRAFIQNNIDIFKWVGVAVVIIQALSLLLAIILRTIVSTKKVDYDSDEEYSVTRGGLRQPLLNQQGAQASASTSVDTKGVQDPWSIRMREKYGLNPTDFRINHVTNTNESVATSRSSEDNGRCSVM